MGNARFKREEFGFIFRSFKLSPRGLVQKRKISVSGYAQLVMSPYVCVCVSDISVLCSWYDCVSGINIASYKRLQAGFTLQLGHPTYYD